MPRFGFHEIATEIRKEIETGRLAPGSALPSESALANTHGVSRPTIRRALAELENAGLVEAVKGRGRFVSASESARVPARTDKKYEQVTEELRSRLESGEIAAGDRLGTVAEIADRLGVSPGTARRALTLLEQDGLVSPVRGAAWFAGDLGVAANRTEAVAAELRAAISEGRYPPGASLPGELLLAGEFGVARITVRRALHVLEAEGLIESRPGLGRRVLAPENRDPQP